MARQVRFRALRDELRRSRPDIADADVDALIAGGDVVVDGSVQTNPAGRVRAGASIVVRPPRTLRGLTKLRGALAAFAVPVEGRVALDAGASAGGFVQALLEAGARRVYAVEVGHGHLLGSLRQDPRVVNLERTNISDLDRRRVPDPVDVVSLDLGFLALAVGVPQLDRIDTAPGADLLALVKPMSELGLGDPPTEAAAVREACERASAGIAAAGWVVAGAVESPIRGSGGAVEWFVHARR
jgi:23S rRNA (cytidine1920-2'-O)/16S rRNA (cytidine1409-2'-O)-methyltransferase